MRDSSRILISLLLGLLGGALLRGTDPALLTAAQVLVLVGELWLKLLQMSVLPLIVALLISGVCSAGEQAGRHQLALRSLAVFAVLLLGSTLISATTVPLLLHIWPVDPAAAEALRQGVSTASPELGAAPPISAWLLNSLPSNPFQAAAEGAVLPLIVFVLLFALAAARLEAAKRAAIASFFEAAGEALLGVVRAVLRLAPIGVFGLALAVGLRGGVAAAGAIAHYLLLICALATLLIALLYPLALGLGRLRLLQFSRAAAPAQAVAFSTQSSLASLPAMLQACIEGLSLPPRVVDIALPLAVSLFKFTSPALNLAVVLFVGHLYGVEFSAASLLAGVAVALLTSIGVAGIPGQASFLTTTVPIAAVMGVPNELLFLLLAVEVLPDLLRTVGNVSADMVACAIIARDQSPVLNPSSPDEPRS
ncbi:dicarboxylate/amino acid:cation symporter [Pseudomarimonas arenosa]|uniref:Cation:dicarboxylase symporter family transporter n=1 Tax=Pseudomarimonas arenosa TaxID=2774145 RepID=A0AAW3ZL01_9GAMM|nr:cation:dicarboxylase symporter family transporter [Pseudomarimonas arenosa]MBD8525867.1 cation:dicarboxylase symporter family transporter [Pseudomarimonas arenosa]